MKTGEYKYSEYTAVQLLMLIGGSFVCVAIRKFVSVWRVFVCGGSDMTS